MCNIYIYHLVMCQVPDVFLGKVKRRSALGPLGTATGGARGDIMAVAIGGLAYMIMLLWGHNALIGIPILRTSFAP